MPLGITRAFLDGICADECITTNGRVRVSTRPPAIPAKIGMPRANASAIHPIALGASAARVVGSVARDS